MLLTANEIQGEGFWNTEIYILKDFKPLKIGSVLVFQHPVVIQESPVPVRTFVTFESFVRNFSDASKENIDKEIKQMLILRGLV